MAEQYFEVNPSVQSAPVLTQVDFWGSRFDFYTDAGVFSKGKLDKGTQILLNSLPDNMQGTLLDLGCGWGAVGIILAKSFPTLKITMSDINMRAVDLAQKNANLNHVDVKVLQSDGFENISDKFDNILLNPPIRAGKALVHELFKQSAMHLNKNGSLYIVIRKQQGAPSAKEFLHTIFNVVGIIERKAGYHVILCKEQML
ncbi:MAG: class I SAM-dependent methyltransferase [Eubacteriales bacterium]|nr:class I SAM-dependent methyltransferase [Eubacteriales bacterium]